MDMKKCSAYESVASAQAGVEQLHVYEFTTWLDHVIHFMYRKQNSNAAKSKFIVKSYAFILYVTTQQYCH